jgi:hypothetical protein
MENTSDMELIGEVSVYRSTPVMTNEAPTRPAGKFESEHVTLGYAPWGDADDLPNKVLADLKKNTLLSPQLNKQALRLAGGGVVAGQIQDVDGEQYFAAVNDIKFRQFIERSNFPTVHLLQCKQAVTHYTTFVEFNLSDDQKEITRMDVVRSKKCRIGLKGLSGLSDFIFVNPDFGTADYKDSNTKTIPCIEDWYHPAQVLKDAIKSGKHKNVRKFIMPISLPGLDGGDYYELPDWDVARSSGWLEYSNSIITYKKALLKNQVVIKYLVWVEPELWTNKYPNWNDLTALEQKSNKQEFLDDMNSFIRDPEAAGASMMLPMIPDRSSGVSASKPAVKFEALESKLQEGAYIEDSKEGFSHLTTALGVDESISGGAPGKSMGAGSGSDKRVAYNIAVTDLKPWQDILLRPLYFIRDFNEWDENLVFTHRSTLISTLDTGSSTKTSTNSPAKPPEITQG